MNALAQLPKLEQAKALLSECTSIDQAKRFHDIAEAARQFARMNKLGLENQNLATEIKIRAGRKAGELLKQAERHSAEHGRPSKCSGTGTLLPTLSDLGFDRKQSHKFQRFAAVTDKALDHYVADAKEHGREITTTAVLRMGKAANQAKPIEHSEPASGTVTDLAALVGQEFGTIYADPPWAYTNTATRANVEGEYAGTMTAAEIAAMPVGELAADDAHLHLWVTKDFIFEAKQVLDAWGFEYKSMFVWVKTQMGIGNYWRVGHELMLLGVRGNAKRFAEHNHKSWMEFPRGRHSAKPDAVRGIIERVSPGPYLELFGRKQVNGWTVFGNQIETGLFPL